LHRVVLTSRSTYIT